MHHHHSHASHSQGQQKRLLFALVLTAGFMLAELLAGMLAGSLALIADAGHMFTDSAALFLALWALRLSHQPADNLRSYGYHRAQIIAALVNGLSLLLMVGWIAWEAASRLKQPVTVLPLPMLLVAIAGLLVNITVFFLLHGASHGNLNIRGALLHVMGDLLGSLAAIVAALVIYTTGWSAIDPLLSLLVALLILRSGWHLLRESVHILLEGTPSEVDVEQIKGILCAEVAAVQDVHHVHVWSLTPERTLLTLHAHIDSDSDYARVLMQIKQILQERFHIHHSTIQLEPQGCADPH